MPVLEKSRSSYLLPIGVATATILLIFAAARFFSRDVVEVHSAPVTYQNLISSVATNGKVEPIAGFYAHAFGPGEVQKVYVQVGQNVKQGQLLVKMDDADAAARLASAQSVVQANRNAAHDLQQNGTQEERIALAGELDRARMQQQQAASDLKALQLLQQKGAASASEIVAAEQRLQSATSTLHNVEQRTSGRYSSGDIDHAKAQVEEAQAAEAAAEVNYKHTDIRSPIDGTVYSIPVSEYDFVSTGEDLIDVADLNHIQIRAYFDEPEIGKLAHGQAVKIVWDAKPNQVWHGHIERAPTTVITYGTRNVGECIIAVDDAHGELLPNTNVIVTVTTSQRFNVLSIPREALHTDGETNYVYRIVSGHLVRTPVQVGIFNLIRVEITGGLSEHDIVARGATSNRDLSDGLAVKAVD